MSDDVLASVARHLALAVEPLEEAVADLDSFQAFMAAVGWEVDSLPPEFTALGTRARAAVQAAQLLVDDPSFDHIATALAAVRDLYQAARAITNAPQGVDPAAFLETVAERTFELLLVDYLAATLPDVFTVLEMTGVITLTAHARAAGRPAFLEKRFLFSEIPAIAADPLSLFSRVYGWGTADLNFERIVDHLHALCTSLSVPASIDFLARADDIAFARKLQAPPAATTKAITLQLRLPIAEARIADLPVPVDVVMLEFPGEEGKLPGFALQPAIPSSVGLEQALAPDLTLRIRAGSDVAARFGIIVRPGEVLVRYPFQPGTPPPEAGFGVSLDYKPPAPSVLLGTAGASRLEVAGAKSELGFAFTNGELELLLASEVNGMQVVLAFDDQDSFLGSLLSGRDVTIPIQLGVRWSNRRGFTFTGGAGFEVTVAPHLELGPITIDTVHVAAIASLSTGAPPGLTAGADVTMRGAFGPIAFTVEGIGVEVAATFEAGNAGPFDLEAGFKPPKGLGIVVDSSLVSGGGFLSYDRPNGRYAGILQLRIAEIGVTAIGLLDTKMPDGQPGYSFLIIVAATFSPIQLGYGFTLNGVGGLAGVHRTMALDALQAGLRNSSLDHILFPDDPIANAAQIISDIRSYFPPAQGRFVFGPMALIGWGTPTLLHIRLGILLELPAPVRLVLIGQLRMTLPTEETPLLELNIDILGVLDFEARRLAVDALIHDSRIGPFALTGAMAFRFDWGADPSLLLAIGGVNPHYQPPPGFPALQPVTVALGVDDNPRITLKGYCAQSPNTCQIGALAELYAAYGGFNIYGWIGFDALLIYDPFFSFVADFSGGVKLSRGSRRLAGVQLEATLSGVAPFHAKGRACISLWLFDVCVRFDKRFGSVSEVLLAALDPTSLLLAAVADIRNWSGTLPLAAWRAVSVTTPAVPDESQALIDPVGGVAFRQRVLPLNRRITLFGDATPSGPGRYDVTAATLGDQSTGFTAVQEAFAPSQFERLTDAQKLSLPSFAKMDAGVELAGDALTAGPGLDTDLVYETRIVDRPWAGYEAPSYPLPLHRQTAMLAAGAAARAPHRTRGSEKFIADGFRRGSRPVSLDEEPHVIAGVSDLAARADFGLTLSRHDAFSRLAHHLELHPEDRGALQVVPRSEAVAGG